jgi:hypothetical protein
MEWKERLNAEISQSGTKEQRFCRNLKDCVLRLAGYILTLKLAYAMFGVYNGVERAFKLRNITIRNEITDFPSKCDSLHLAICREYFDTEIGVVYIRCVEWSEKTVYTTKYLNQERYMRVFVEI